MFTKIDEEDLDSSCREFSNGGLGFVVARLVRSGIDFSCASTGGPIQLYLILAIIDKNRTEIAYISPEFWQTI